MNERQTAYVATIPPKSQQLVTRALTRTGGRMNAIKAKCLSCCNYTREEVRECTVDTCPLHPWRPFQPKVGAIEGSETPQEDPNYDPDLDGPLEAEEEDDEEL